LPSLLSKHASVFKDELGTISPFKATLRIRANVTPKFCKTRTVPYTTKRAIDSELEQLEANSILKKVTYSDWAAPIVAVPKKDGTIHISGDYKVTINQALVVDQYLLPNLQK
jgi:hypothetical protein